MIPDARAQATFRFGAFEVDLRTREVRKSGYRIRLQDHSFKILALLLERPGEVVPRTELRDALWPDGTIVDFENGLNAAMGKLRQALCDSAAAPRYIETVARYGYRFIASLESVELPPPADKPVTVEPRHRRRFAWVPAVCGAAITLVAGILGAFQWLNRASARSGERLLLVLPFRDFSKGEADRYLADGITEELTTYLSRLDPSRLAVIARTSAEQYSRAAEKGAPSGPQRRLDYLLEGSIRRDQEHVRVTVQLIRASDQTHIWAANYDRTLGDALALEAEIAGAVAYRMHVTLGGETRSLLSQTKSVTPAAYDAWLKGRYYLWSHEISAESLYTAAESFREALRADGRFAPAYAGLAEYYCSKEEADGAVVEPDVAEVRRNSARALELDPQLAEGRLEPYGAPPVETSAYIYARCGRRRDAQRIVESLERSFRPGSLSSYRIAVIEAALGNKAEAVSWMEKAYESRNPYVSLRINTDPRLDPLRSEPRFQRLIRLLAYPD